MIKKPKIRWGSLLAGVVSVVGILGDPDLLGYLPHKVGAAVGLAGVVVAAYKKSVIREEHERIQ